MFLNVLMSADVVFNYDAEAGTLTAQNVVFLVDNSQYYFDSYRGCVLKKAVEKAAMPANPSISGLQDSDFGYVVTFSVPNVDTEGNALVSSKLSYIIYADIEGEIAPLTFTPATHSKLEADMTEIPFGFTENYDFYNGQIYLNELYSADWNNLGIQSIYRGGGEEHKSNIGWYDIIPTGINGMAMDAQSSRTYDLQGRLVNGNAKGLLIKQVRQADGTVKAVKVIRK